MTASGGTAPATSSAPVPPAVSAAPPEAAAQRASLGRGILAGIGAFGAWGLLPLYLHALQDVPPLQILAHRILWSLLLMLALVRWLAPPGATARVLRSRRALLLLTCSTVLIAVNWLLFIQAVATKQTVAASLGYYINPLISVLLSVVILKEPLSRRNAVSVALAAAGVAWLVWIDGALPWISLVLAVSFALYGLVRKLAGVDPMVGLLVETALCTPLCLGYVLWLGATGDGAFLTHGPATDLLLVGCGIVTALPLICFGMAAVRLPLAMLGLLQYLAPTLQLLCAVALLGESFDSHKAVAFGCIWAALALFSWDMARQLRR